MKSTLMFYKQRLKHASVVEIFVRARQAITLLYLRILKKINAQELEKPHVKQNDIQNLRMPEIFIENGQPFYLSNLLDTQKIFNPLRIDPESIKEDIRIRWEPSRLQQATALIAYSMDASQTKGGRAAKKAAKAIIFSWLENNPFLKGEDYLSAMECALRIPVFFYAIKCVGADLTERENTRLLKAIYLHTLYVSHHLSLYSSLGNHTIAEAVGLVFGGAVFRNTKKGGRWLRRGLNLLESELYHQVLDDGGPGEQSLTYHRFVLDLYWLAVDFIEKNRLSEVEHWKPSLISGEFFLNGFMDDKGGIPAIGDSDDGVAVAAGLKPARMSGETVKKKRITFDHSGYSIIKENDFVFSFDHGPLGMAPFHNHGHADALSITLSKSGYPLLVDSGTFRYNGVSAWRKYFKGTRAHNTVTIDDCDQAEQETSFIWGDPYHAKLTTVQETKGALFLQAEHDGYQRLKNPVRHRRSVLYRDQAILLIKDIFFGTGRHSFELNFHFHPNAVLHREEMWWVVDHCDARIYMRLIEGDFKMVHGRTQPICGWYSPQYGHKVPTSVLTFAKTGNTEDVIFTTAIFTQSPF